MSEVSILQTEYDTLKADYDKLQSRMAGVVHELNELRRGRDQDIIKLKMKNDALCAELEETQRLLRRRNDQYQADCILINRLNTTIEVQAQRLATWMKGNSGEISEDV